MVFFIEAEKQPEAFVVCGSVQSVALHLDSFEEKADIGRICDEKLAAYYRRLA